MSLPLLIGDIDVPFLFEQSLRQQVHQHPPWQAEQLPLAALFDEPGVWRLRAVRQVRFDDNESVYKYDDNDSVGMKAGCSLMQLGPFRTDVTNFEEAFAKNYTAFGYRTAFFPGTFGACTWGAS